MNEINFGGFVLMLCVMVSAALVVGFTAGFGGFLAYVATIALFTWLYGALVVNRPRVQVVGVWQWRQFGSQLVYMEVA